MLFGTLVCILKYVVNFEKQHETGCLRTSMIFALGRIRWIRPINCQLDGILSVKNGRFVLRCRRVELRYLCPSARSSLAVSLAIVSGHAVRGFAPTKIGRGTCRDRVCQYV